MAKKQLKKKLPVNKYPGGGWKKATSFGAKALKYLPSLVKSTGAKTVLGPASLLLGATKAYAPPVINPKTGINKFTGDQTYTPMNQGPPASWGDMSVNVADVNQQLSAAMAPKINQQGGVRKYHQGGEYMDTDSMDMDAHMQEPHHTGGNTGGDTGSMYGPNSDNPTGPPMEWGAGWNMGGTPGLGIRTAFGDFGSSFEYPKTLKEGLGMLAGPAANLTGLADKGIHAAKSIRNQTDKWFSRDGGVRHQTGGMYTKMQQYQQGGVILPGEIGGPGMNIMQQHQFRKNQNQPIIPPSPLIPPTPPVRTFGQPSETPITDAEAIQNLEASGLGGRGRNTVQQVRRQTGGVLLPGGQMQPIEGSDAVQFNGASHEQGGIELDPQTEVEGGETMDQVTMRDGGKKDYFFSSHLKHGGQPFSARHKQILEMGGSQSEIDNLARIQEQTAGRDEGQVAATGGYRESYANGGIKSPFDTKEDERAFQDWANEKGYDTKGNTQSQYGWGQNSQRVYDEYFTDYQIEKTLLPEVEVHDTTDEVSEEKEDNGKEDNGKGYKRRGDIDLVTGLAMGAQVLPALKAMAEDPDYMGLHSQYSASNAGMSMSPELKKIRLKRINMDADRERNAGDLRSMNKFIENSGMGPAGIANRMAAYAKKQQGDREITAQEAKINAGISNRETQTNVDIEKTNVANTMANTQFNARQQNALNMRNAELAWKTDEFNAAAKAATKDRRLMGLQSAMQSFAGINSDRLMYNAQDRIAQAMAGDTGVLTREEIARDLSKAYPHMAVESQEFKTMAEETYLKMIKSNASKSNQNQNV